MHLLKQPCYQGGRTSQGEESCTLMGPVKLLRTDAMIISITGATGFIGRRLVQRLATDGHKIQILTRSTSKAQLIFPAKDYPGIIIAEEPDWVKYIQGSTAVVNLAGTPIGTRWSPQIKADIKNSRVSVTSKVVEAINIANVENRPSVFVSATAVGYYGTSERETFDESSPSGNDYLAEVCRDWETTAQKVDVNVRLVLIRTAKMIPLFMMFAGGPVGTGKQWFSWVHRDDLVSLIIEALSNPTFKGVINGTSPNPVRLAEMCDHLGTIMGRPSWLPVPEFAVKAILGEGASVVLDGQRVLPKKAKELGFTFKYRYITDALKAILSS
eukprot:Gb_40061 [translate_table: standard]